MKLRVVILNYFGQEDVVQCLLSLYRNLQVPTDIVIWNNGGEFEKIESFIKERSSLLIQSFLVPSSKNLGFAPAVNKALEWNPLRKFDSLLLFNSDATLLTPLTENLVKELEKLKGIVGFRVYNNEQKTKRQKSARHFPNLMTAFTSRQSFFAKLFPNNPFTRKYLNTDLKEDQIQKVDWVSGCSLYCPHALWKQLGGFDEAYFFGVEDVDLGRTAQKKKIPVYYSPQPEVLHIGGVAASRSHWKSDFYHHLGMWNYFVKWAKPLEFLIGPFVFLGIALRFLLRRLYQVRTDF